MEKFETVDEYINSFDAKKRQLLLEFRNRIKKLAPESLESMSYGMPGYKLNGHPLVYFAGFKSHVSLFPTAKNLGPLEKDVKEYRTGKGTLQFKDGKTIPWDLIEKIINFRSDELTS